MNVGKSKRGESMKVGEKYVIEIDRLYSGAFYPELAGIKGFNSLVFDENGLSKLKRLENVAKDIRQEAYNLGFEQATKQLKEECNRAREEGRQEGYELAFTGVKPHDGCEGCEYELCDGDPCTTCKGSYVDKYKPKVKDEFKVGDEVKDFYYDHGAKGVVTREKDGKVYIVWSDGSYGWRKKESPEIGKTGKQYPCIAEVLEQLNNE